MYARLELSDILNDKQIDFTPGDTYTDRSRILHTLLVKHYNGLLDNQSSEQGKDEVTYFYVGDIFCIHLGTKCAYFQEKIFAERFLGKSSKLT